MNLGRWLHENVDPRDRALYEIMAIVIGAVVLAALCGLIA